MKTFKVVKKEIIGYNHIPPVRVTGCPVEEIIIDCNNYEIDKGYLYFMDGYNFIIDKYFILFDCKFKLYEWKNDDWLLIYGNPLLGCRC